jgi:hypothetical protein
MAFHIPSGRGEGCTIAVLVSGTLFPHCQLLPNQVRRSKLRRVHFADCLASAGAARHFDRSHGWEAAIGTLGKCLLWAMDF